jgi:hypothetical protein
MAQTQSLAELRAEYHGARDAIKGITERAKFENRDLNGDEAKQVLNLRAKMEHLSPGLVAASAQYAEMGGEPDTAFTSKPYTMATGKAMGAALREMLKTGQTTISDIREVRGILGSNSPGTIFEPVANEDYAAKLATPFELAEYGLILDPNQANYTKFPYQVGDLIPNQIGEASAIDAGGLTIGSYPVALTKFAVIQKVSLEVTEDYPGVYDMIGQSAAVGFSTAVSRHVFTRIDATANIQTIDCTAINASAFGYDNLLTGLRSLESVNVNPRRAAFVCSPRISENLASRKDTTGQYIQPPAKLSEVPMLTTSAILETYSGNTATKAYLADWSSVRVIVRGIGAAIVPSNTSFTAERNVPTFTPGMMRVNDLYIGTGEIGVLYYLRADVVVHRPDNIVQYNNLKF